MDGNVTEADGCPTLTLAVPSDLTTKETTKVFVYVTRMKLMLTGETSVVFERTEICLVDLDVWSKRTDNKD